MSRTVGERLYDMFNQTLINISASRLLSNLKSIVPSLDPTIVLNAGATTLTEKIPAEFLGGVRLAYNNAIMDSFYVATALAAVSVFGAVAFEWKSVKGQKIEMAAA